MKNQLRQTLRLAKFSIKNRYRNTYAGILWVFLQPIIQFGIQAYAFKYVVKIEQSNYLIFLLSGLLPWVFLTTSIEMSVGMLMSQSAVFKSMVISPLSFVLAQVLDNFLVLLVGLVLATFALSFIEPISQAHILLLVPAAIPLLVSICGLSVIAATYQVFFRDLRFILTFGMQSLYFLTPILYPVDFIPEEHRWIVNFNPIYYLIKPFRSALFESQSVYFQDLGISLVFSIIIGIISWKIWERKANEVILNV